MRIEAPDIAEEAQMGEPAVEDLDESGSAVLGPEERASIRILVIDDEQSILDSCESVLAADGYQCECERKADDALHRIKSQSYDIVLIDQSMPQVHGLDILAEVRQRSPGTIAIMMTGHATTEASIRAMKAGAWEYVPKPFTATQLLVVIGRAAYTLLRQRTLSDSSRREGVLVDGNVRILGVSSAMRKAIETAMKVARTDASVFITGDSGTGKELIAQYIHGESRRARKAFVAVNCAALPGELLESEMFGHRRGAFTGAVRDKPGLLEVADQGTFFLDELGEMPMPLQAKLLRVLQDGVIRRVGSEKDDAVVDVRFVSATNREPELAIRDGQLRQDLYFRLRVVPVHLPPLRDRSEDIPVLIKHFIDHFWRRHQLPGALPPRLSPDAMEALVRHDWPGNVRELQNVIEHLVVLSEAGENIERERLSILEEGATLEVMGGGSATPQSVASLIDFHAPFHDAKDALIGRFEREYLAQVVARTQGNMSEAARQAGIDRTTLYRLMDKHELSKDAFVQ
ncbi:MAG: sigma-54 dependent transcriptional regulator [Gemmatimonadota bacterium]|nr:sigma-54 dependent transcriptional regulator [Gemmatimonadota bacterium]